MSLTIPFDNSFARMPSRFFAPQDPVPVAAPSLISLNHDLAQELGIDPGDLASPDGVQVLAGNTVPNGAAPLSQAYAGHQFGGWVPQLGDGRAVMLGEVIDNNGIRRDIQLKGSGRTPYSRGGDGRAWLGPVLREFTVSEAMHALGIPTTRALAAVTTGQQVQRETALPGAILTRVAASHIRVGTFQYFAARQDTQALQALCEHVIARHYPEAGNALEMLDQVVAAQASLIAKWMSVGFIHGVMNTDNMTISGETIDYGPCAFMDGYRHDTVYSAIDQFGRYAYNRQPDIAAWNLAQLASSLLPLMGEEKSAVRDATTSIHRFADHYEKAWLREFRAKLGLGASAKEDEALINRFLNILETSGADFTNSFRSLAEGHGAGMIAGEAYALWYSDWQARQTDTSTARMIAANPAFIPRNHLIEAAIQAGLQDDFAPFARLNAVLARPFDNQPEHDDLRAPPEPEEEVKRTFCGT